MNRVVVALVGLCLSFAPASRADEARRPNIVWICADDHAAYVTGTYGNKQVRTPNIDRLAASGMRFDRAYCNSPVCTASRQSFLTGRYPRTIGVTLLQTPLPESEMTLADILKGVGYETVSIGKMHFNSQLMHGFDVRIDTPEANAALKQRGATPFDATIEVLPAWKPFQDPARVWLNGLHRPYGAVDADMEGTYFANQAARFLEKPHAEPFFLMVSFYEPHSPFRYPVEYRDRHSPKEFDPPAVAIGDDDQIPEIFRSLTADEKRGIIASYYTSVEFLDKNVGIVLDAIDTGSLGKDTIVIYTGDHGYMLGQHGRFEKHCSYEEAVRAPLLMRVPDVTRPGSSTEALVELIDIAPTVLDACGIAIPSTVQGRSLWQLLLGKTDKHRDHVIVEYAQNDEIMIRDETFKFIYERGRRERTDGYKRQVELTGTRLRLFNLVNDPHELQNLVGPNEPLEQIVKFVELLAAHLKQSARLPEHISNSEDLFEVLNVGVQPHDVEPRKKAVK